jgi:hypothetical protein
MKNAPAVACLPPFMMLGFRGRTRFLERPQLLTRLYSPPLRGHHHMSASFPTCIV